MPIEPNVPKSFVATSAVNKVARKSNARTYVIASLIILTFIAIAYFVVSQNQSSSPAIIISPTANFTTFASALRLPTPLQFVYTSVLPITQCGVSTETAYIFYSQHGLGTTSQQINYSTISRSEPFVEYISVSTFNASQTANFANELNRTNGYCTSGYQAVLSNTTYNQVKTNFSGIPGYLWTFTNFTEEGLRLAQVNYTPGSRPNVTLGMSSVLYKNYYIRVSMWTLANHINTTAINEYTNLTVDAFKAR